MKSAPWLELRRRLYEQEDRFFERGVESVLRFKYPEIVQTPSKQRLDKAGIDLVSRDMSGAIDVAVQCKGFSVTIPGSDQIQQAKESLDAFMKSGEHAKHFIFVHNRDGRAREFSREVRAMLAALVSAGKCETTDFFDLEGMLVACKEALRERLDRSLRLAAERKLAEFRNIFEVTGDPLREVPTDEKLLFLGLAEPSRIEDVSPMKRRNVRELLRSRSDAKFTLLIGNFGTGKSTASLLAASANAASEPTIIFAECAYFAVKRLGSGLSVLLEEALKAADAFSELPSRDHEVFRLASPLLREELGGRDQKLDAPHKYVLLLDGLDENRLYARPEGMAILINSLADIRVPIVLTTRREHLISTFDNMQAGQLVFAEKHGWKKPIRIFSLGSWEHQDICKFVEGSAQVLEREDRLLEAGRIREFLKVLAAGSDREFYGDLAAHPLFLRLILDDVAAHGVRQAGRAQLLWNWAHYKIRRDIARKGKNIDQDWHFESNFPDRIMRFMEEVAMAMCERHGNTLILIESARDQDIASIAAKHFPSDAEAVIKVLLNSLLIPHHLSADARYTVHFVYRAFHEFFLACHLVRNGLDFESSGTQVSQFVEELKTGNFAWINSPPSRLL